MTRIPDRAEHRRRWSGLEFADRRRIMKAVNRGRALDDRTDAALAVGVARQQQRFWSRIWLIGPAVALLQLPQGWLAVATNAVVSVAILGALSWWSYRRAARAERANREVVGETGRAHLPSEAEPEPQHRRPYKPRGKKRRHR